MLVKQESKAHLAIPHRAVKHIEWRTINGRKVPIRQQDFENNRRQEDALEDDRSTR